MRWRAFTSVNASDVTDFDTEAKSYAGDHNIFIDPTIRI